VVEGVEEEAAAFADSLACFADVVNVFVQF
jgi:hypothetical protein